MPEYCVEVSVVNKIKKWYRIREVSIHAHKVQAENATDALKQALKVLKLE